jgi:hypothetical protein
MDKFLDSLYTKLVLRDALGKTAPGSMLLVTLYISVLSQAPNLHEAVQAMRGVPAIDWLPVLAAGWLTALALQALGGQIPERWYLPYIRYCSDPNRKDADVKEFYRGVVHFDKCATEDQRQLFERSVVLHEASGNSSLALVLAAGMLAARFHGWQDLLLYLAMLIVAVGLGLMHRVCIDLKMAVFSEVMAQPSSMTTVK